MRFEVDMIQHPTKPIIPIKLNGIECTALIDSGAEMFVLVRNITKYKLDTSKDEMTKLLGISDTRVDNKSNVNENVILTDKIGRGKIDIVGYFIENDIEHRGRLQLFDVPIAMCDTTDKYDLIVPHTFLQYFDYGISGEYRGDRKLVLCNNDYKFSYHFKDNFGYITDVISQDSEDDFMNITNKNEV